MKASYYYETIQMKGYRINNEIANGDNIIGKEQLKKLKKLFANENGILFFFKLRSSGKEWTIIKEYHEFKT